jgi:hypothetical protein
MTRFLWRLRYWLGLVTHEPAAWRIYMERKAKRDAR